MSNVQKLKYSLVENEIDETETVDFEPMKRKFCSPTCVKASIFTSILIGAYYIPSIGLTFYQRWFLQTFQFPLITVIVHMSVKFLLSVLIRFILVRQTKRENAVMEWKDHLLQVAPTGFFSGIDIGFSNWGLELITISLYTMTKSTTIVFILFFSILFKLEKMTWSLCGIVGMITTGLLLFTYKATQFNLLGFLLLLLASISSGLRWTCVQILLQKSKLGMKNPVDMIYNMQPWMILSVLPFALWIEGPIVVESLNSKFDYAVFVTFIMRILFGAFIAFFMEFSEVTLVTYTSSLTLSIAGIFKEAFILVLGVKVNGDIMTPINTLGLLVCLGGIATHVIHKLRTSTARQHSRFEFENDRLELNDKLIYEEALKTDTDSDGEKSDSQVLFDILNRHDR
ncbi:unnamed protein product [Brassicogethes aeneus]|uniref:Sugar phosphate transporter domain-containing protein n=1 Tax=Brassicogethes aeneus TaxID=1431903 RepID=A0A9P0ARM0_BRAAE|nr:unnamed protein product [Brassicogethes aeneus]